PQTPGDGFRTPLPERPNLNPMHRPGTSGQSAPESGQTPFAARRLRRAGRYLLLSVGRSSVGEFSAERKKRLGGTGPFGALFGRSGGGEGEAEIGGRSCENALRPARGLRQRVSLRRSPSLHPLRRRWRSVLVRRLLRYYATVRLPNAVHAGRTAAGL